MNKSDKETHGNNAGVKNLTTQRNCYRTVILSGQIGVPRTIFFRVKKIFILQP